MSTALTVVQLAALLAVLVGVALILPLGGALVVDGVLVLVAATAAEHLALRRPSAPSDRRRGPNSEGVA